MSTNTDNDDRRDAFYRLNALENLLSKGTVILSVGRSSECGPAEVYIEGMNSPMVTGTGNLRNALDELRKQTWL
jgi:hypothetical protein